MADIRAKDIRNRCKRTFRAILAVVAGALAAPSCSTAANVSLSNDGSAFAESTTEYSASFDELAKAFDSVADVAKLKEENRTFLTFVPGELKEKFAGSENGMLEVAENENGTTYSFRIDKTNYRKLNALFPALDNEKVLQWTAEENENVSEEEYLEMLNFVFGEDIERDFAKSVTTATFVCETGFRKSNGLTANEDGTLTLKVRAIDFALLKSPIEFSFTV